MKRSRAETGAALVETILLVVILIVPVVWLLAVLAQFHRAGLAATAAAREAAVAAARATDPVAARQAADAAVGSAFADQGLSPAPARVGMRGTSALRRGTEVSVRVSYPVDVAHVPFLDPDLRIWVRATHVSEVDLYRSRDAAD